MKLPGDGRVPGATAWTLAGVGMWALIPTLAVNRGVLSLDQFLTASHALSAATLGALALWTGAAREFRFYSAADIKRLAALGAVGICLSSWLLFGAYEASLTSGSHADAAFRILPLHHAWPMFAVLVTWMLAAQAPNWRSACAVVCTTVVVAAMTADTDAALSPSAGLRALGGAMALGLYRALGHRLRYDSLTSSAIMFASASALTFAASLTSQIGAGSPWRVSVEGPSLAALVISGVVAHAGSVACWHRAARLDGEQCAASWLALTPLVAACVLSVVSGATPSGVEWLALGLLTFAAWLVLGGSRCGAASWLHRRSQRRIPRPPERRRLADESI